ncbi:hypothetical protein COV22_00045, partial [Candidatus Woesearchaeota archaeon CG10_big_fil_rev_8_21_14_0_10_47_5]
MTKAQFNPEEIRRLNNEDRMWYVKYWANYVRSHPDEVWSRQQNVIINSQVRNARSCKLSAEEYLRVKG